MGKAVQNPSFEDVETKIEVVSFPALLFRKSNI